MLLNSQLLQEISVWKEKQKLERTQRSQGGQVPKPKKTKQFYKTTVEEIDGSYYLIGSSIFKLGGNPSKLTQEDIQELPLIISWRGPMCEFITDEKECIRLFCQIIEDMNNMQNPTYVDFPLGRFANFVMIQVFKYKC
jgi:hypothetical protein